MRKKENKVEPEISKEDYIALPSKRKGEWQAVIEIPKGSKYKRAIHRSRPWTLVLERKVPKAFKCAYGFIPSTIAPDGECVDVFVFGKGLRSLDVVPIEIIAMLRMCDDGVEDNKVIAHVKEEDIKVREMRKVLKYLQSITQACENCNSLRIADKDEAENYLLRRTKDKKKRVKESIKMSEYGG